MSGWTTQLTNTPAWDGILGWRRRHLDCSVDSFWLIGFLVWFVVGPGFFREGPGSPEIPMDGTGLPPEAPGAPGAQVKKNKKPKICAGPC